MVTMTIVMAMMTLVISMMVAMTLVTTMMGVDDFGDARWWQ